MCGCGIVVGNCQMEAAPQKWHVSCASIFVLWSCGSNPGPSLCEKDHLFTEKQHVHIFIYLYIYICIDWESWCCTQSDMIFLYLKKDLLFDVCVCFHFFFLLLWVCVCVLHVSISMCVWVYALACVDIGEQFKLGFFIYHFTSYFWDRASLLNL